MMHIEYYIILLLFFSFLFAIRELSFVTEWRFVRDDNLHKYCVLSARISHLHELSRNCGTMEERSNEPSRVCTEFIGFVLRFDIVLGLG